MINRIILGFSGAIVVVVLLLAGSSLGAYVRAQVEEQEAGAIACHDSVSCSRADWVMKVINTGTGYGIYGRTNSSKGAKAAVYGYAHNKARGVFGKSKNGDGVYGKSTNGFGVYGKTNSSDCTKAGVYGEGTGLAFGVKGEHSTGNLGYLGSSSRGVYGYASGGNGVYGGSSTDTGVYGKSTDGTGVHGSSTNGTGVYAESWSGNLFEGWDSSGGPDLMFRVDNAGNIWVERAIYLKESSAPSTPPSNECAIYLDSSDGDLKVKFDDGTVKTLATD